MNKILLLLSLLCISFKLKAQTTGLGCGNGRYINYIFPDVEKTTDIIFGYNTTTDYFTSNTYNNTLRLDFYEPAADTADMRPLIILAFGGGFINGQRSDMDSICIALSRKGYATATIDYRLIYPNTLNIFLVYSNAARVTDEVIKASSDMKAAIRFFKRDAATTNTYKIDTTKIFVGGGSSGAIAALQTAYTNDISENPAATPIYLANGGFEGNTDFPAPNNLLPAYNSTGIAGVVNIAGGIADTNLIDADNPPVYSGQGTADEVIPYDYGPISYNGTATAAVLYGSRLIQTRANNINLYNQLYSVPGGNHESVGTQPYISEIIDGASAFLQPIVCGSIVPVTLTYFRVQNSNCAALLRWQTAMEQQSSHYDIETSADGIRFVKTGMIKSRNISTGTTYTYNMEGYRQTGWFRLKMVNKDGGFTYSPVQKFNPCIASIQLYPNPAQTHAVVAGLARGMQVRIINAEGKLLVSQKALGNTMQIPLAAFANGLYLVQVMDTDGKVLKNSKLIKN